MRKIIYNEEEKQNLEKALLNSKTLREILIKLGKNESSSSYKLLQRRLKFYELDHSHILNKSDILKIRHLNKRKENKDIFTEDSTVARSSVKKRIIQENLIPYKCEKCSNNGDWNGQKLTLILDHINGIPTDNRLSNLRFVCPNCNSLLETHCKGNKGLLTSCSSTDKNASLRRKKLEFESPQEV